MWKHKHWKVVKNFVLGLNHLVVFMFLKYYFTFLLPLNENEKSSWKLCRLLKKVLQIDKDYGENRPKKRITKKSKKQFYDSEYFVYFVVWLSGSYFTQFSKKFNKEPLKPSLLYWFWFFSKSHVLDDLNACKCYVFFLADN